MQFFLAQESSNSFRGLCSASASEKTGMADVSNVMGKDQHEASLPYPQDPVPFMQNIQEELYLYPTTKDFVFLSLFPKKIA